MPSGSLQRGEIYLVNSACASVRGMAIHLDVSDDCFDTCVMHKGNRIRNPNDLHESLIQRMDKAKDAELRRCISVLPSETFCQKHKSQVSNSEQFTRLPDRRHVPLHRRRIRTHPGPATGGMKTMLKTLKRNRAGESFRCTPIRPSV